MKIHYNKKQLAIVVRRLKRKDALHYNYLDELVDSTVRILANKLANKGPVAQCKFLLANGWSVKEIVQHGKITRRIIRKHMVEFLTKDKKKKRR